jgi:hypothetical protein
MPESSQALFHRCILRTQRDAGPDRGGGRTWRVMVTNASGNSVYDPALRGTWISRTEAEEHAEKITRDYMKAQGYPEATDSPDWQDSN